MEKEQLINKTLNTLHQLPPEKVQEIADFADFLLRKSENVILTKGIEKLSEQSLEFLNDEEDIYTKNDLKERY
ncbi:DUF2281 domain-containing protein [Marinoscillum furvescens]|uniref:Uncharacterized protein DUF2281 n=1 Tax=Marinoscillum furvescens DSM 4134 TaxID=1122208 RepID=A0A3D9L681_MARFU|nr:DUF2281 domain-containing protein [Marinoscillum furvescens]REE01206.1 uncharacterized protein DUF2281 [Marinoscillum furvescens DSM 4134]